MYKYIKKLLSIKLSHWLLRIPLSTVFIQQGISKFPVTIEEAETYELPFLVWWFVAYGELGAGFGLLIGGLLLFCKNFLLNLGDVITRFSGFTIGCITTGVIWISKPESFINKAYLVIFLIFFISFNWSNSWFFFINLHR